jgi:hypothetical protein
LCMYMCCVGLGCAAVAEQEAEKVRGSCLALCYLLHTAAIHQH